MNEHKQTDEGHLLRPQKPNPPPLLRRHRMLNRITMTGRLVADPELRRTQSGVSVTSFRIANDRDYGKGEEKETDFFDVVAWRSTAEFICKYFTKGRMISVDGRLQTSGVLSAMTAWGRG